MGILTKFLDLGQPINWASSLNRGMVSRWQVINQGAYSNGARFLDIAARNHGTLTNGPTWGGALGRPGGRGSLTFDGTNDTVDVPTTTTLSSTQFTTKASLSAWLNPDSFGNWKQAVANGRGYDAIFGYGLSVVNADKIAFYVGTWNVVAEATATAGVWTHALGTYDYVTGDIKIYLNGLLKATTNVPGGTTDVSAPGTITMGAGLLGTYYAGKIDDVRIWPSRVLSDADAWGVYTQSIRRDDPTLNWITKRAYSFVSPAAAGGLSIPVAMHNYRRRRVA